MEAARLRQEVDRLQREAEGSNKTLATLLESEAEAHGAALEQVSLFCVPTPPPALSLSVSFSLILSFSVSLSLSPPPTL